MAASCTLFPQHTTFVTAHLHAKGYICMAFRHQTILVNQADYEEAGLIQTMTSSKDSDRFTIHEMDISPYHLTQSLYRGQWSIRSWPYHQHRLLQCPRASGIQASHQQTLEQWSFTLWTRQRSCFAVETTIGQTLSNWLKSPVMMSASPSHWLHAPWRCLI